MRHEAMRYWTSSHVVADGPAGITVVNMHDEVALDVDNIIKPIQDALVGLVFPDDAMVTDVISRRRQLGGMFDLSRASPVRENLPLERIPSSALFKELFSLGLLSRQGLDIALRAFSVRNSLVHGFESFGLEGSFGELALLVQELLTEFDQAGSHIV